MEKRVNTSSEPRRSVVPEAQEIPWNLVTKNLIGHELLRKKLREKIRKLEKHLKHFPTDAVHLHVSLERDARRKRHTASLTLRLPSNILHCRKSAIDVIKAFNSAVDVLLRELVSLKARLRRESAWKRPVRRQHLREQLKRGFSEKPQSEGDGPQEQQEVVREFIRRQYRALLRHARRQVALAELSGEVPPGALDFRGITDEVIRLVLTGQRKKPARAEWLAWFYQLLHEELLRRRREMTREVVSLEEVEPSEEEAEVAGGYDAEQPLDIVVHCLEPFLTELREMVPDVSANSPDREVARRDLIEYIHERIQSWPKLEREVFDLYFLEGFEPDEIAMILRESPAQAERLIADLQGRVREFLIEETQ